GFSLETGTLELLRQCTAWLATVSGDRIRHELELVLKEEVPEKALKRADELDVLDRVHPSLIWDDWLSETFAEVRTHKLPEGVSKPDLYLALLCYRMPKKDLEQLAGYLRLSRATMRMLNESAEIRAKRDELARTGLAPSIIYELLSGYSATALTANLIAISSQTAAEHIELYLNVLRHVRPALSGEAIKRLGIPAGKEIKLVLKKLREARLDGRISSRREEEELVKAWAAERQPGPSGSG
ncbi:MAG: hypothetical protein N2506_07775, partial [Dehalococcoidales bacterium]|nr:hypothetical protein [Dehalococcoidales bacterium]